MNPTPNWMLVHAVLLLAACQRHVTERPRDGGSEAKVTDPTPALALGTIAGRAKLSGTSPPPRAVRLSPELERPCGRYTSEQTLRVNDQGALADVVVYLEDVPSSAKDTGLADLPPIIVDQRGCVFWPPVAVARAGGVLEVVNSDPLLHNVRANRDSEALFNFAMPIQGMRSRKQLPSRPGIVRLQCDVHPWMRAVIRTFDHSFYALTNQSGDYQLTKVPSGRHKLIFWHPRLPQEAFELETSKEHVIQDVSWSADEVGVE